MDELSDEFIRRVIRMSANQAPHICKKIMIALADGDHVAIKELLPGVFE